MFPAMRNAGLVLAAAGLAGVTVAGCSSGADGGARGGDPGAARTVVVPLTSQGCAPQPRSVPAGPTTFEVTNQGASSVTEGELLRQGRILGEKESLTPGLSGSFTLDLEPGSYQVYCPGAQRERFEFIVTPAAPSDTAPSDIAPSDIAPSDTALSTATDGYRDYVVEQSARLVDGTTRFAAAVKAGDLERAKALYAPTRMHYERIEPVAESFGRLDPAIDARVNDVADAARWTGFHRIEKALWADATTDGAGGVAEGLVADVQRLQARVRQAAYQPAQLANGAVELLDEVAKSKITGEEERYSHTDGYDIAANVQGARRASELLEPALTARRPELAATISARFDDVEAALAPLRRGDGFVSYTRVEQAQRRALAQRINALAAPLSKVAAVIV